MTLGQQQQLFMKLLGEFLVWIYSDTHRSLTGGELYRTPEQALLNAQKGIGIKDSVHTKKLAIDLNLFIDGHYMTDAAAYAPLGEKWKSLHPLCRHGGDFRGGVGVDAGHFSIEWQGVK